MEFMLISFLECDENLAPIVRFVKSIFTIIQFLIPIGLIIMGSVDLGKAVLSSDDKEYSNSCNSSFH